eukprot:TRINITY_DN49131_c0_g2_i1.p1 TRINITY_DN49131_c0_g2~~TRINITY_DN49131_c0_g2_i1.p1  ORF type:complete len:423 (-),score=79.32 TRINITY_DN49131_c0_g2_i1:76-1344(-)
MNTPHRHPRQSVSHGFTRLADPPCASGQPLSKRTTAVLKRTFDFWCSQIDPGSGMSCMGFLSFCRAARLVSDRLSQLQLLEMFDALADLDRLGFHGFQDMIQQLAVTVTDGDASLLLSEYIFPLTAGASVSPEVRLLFSEGIQRVFQLHRGALQMIYISYSTANREAASAVKTAGYHSTPLGVGKTPSASTGSMGAEDFVKLGAELCLWPELQPSDVHTAFKACGAGDCLSFDGMCEAIFRCTLLMLGERTPPDWMCNCLHQMLSSAYRQLAPNHHPSLKSPSAAVPSTPAPISAISQAPLPPSPWHAITSPFGAAAASSNFTPASNSDASPIQVEVNNRRMHSAYEVLSKLAPHLNSNVCSTDPRQAEQHAELLRARDALVASLVPAPLGMDRVLPSAAEEHPSALEQYCLLYTSPSPRDS